MNTKSRVLGIAVAFSLQAIGSAPAQGILHEIQDGAGVGPIGGRVAGAGDVDGDGFDDVLLGAPLDDTIATDAGRATVVSGKTGSILHSFLGEGADGWFGMAVSGAGDVNGDGFADVIVGAPYYGTSPGNHGRARVFSGKDGVSLLLIDGQTDYGLLGISVSAAGDVDADGHDDVIVGDPGAHGSGWGLGRALVTSGQSGLPLRVFEGHNSWGGYGMAVSGGVDMSGDGVPDLVIGAPYDSTGAYEAGLVDVRSGSTGASLHSLLGDAAVDWFGDSLSVTGDVDGDGLGDLIVGAPDADPNGGGSGLARVFSGASGATLFTFTGDSSGDYGGSSVGDAGDIDGDGRHDLIVGFPGHDGVATNAGLARIYSGLDGSVLREHSGDNAQDRIGAVSGANDVNADGVSDQIIGAWYKAGGVEVGYVRVLSGTCGAAITYGAGCPGSGGFVPTLTLAGCLTPGGTVTVNVGNALGGSAAFFFLGQSAVDLPMGGGCSLLVAPLSSPIGPLPLGGSGAGAGSFALTTTLPMESPLATLTLQTFVVDGAGANGFVTTAGLALAIE